MKKSFHIRSAVRTVKRIFTGICGIMLLSQTGCIREGGHCYCQIYLYIVAETESADFDDALDGADLFLFDNDHAYVSTTQISAADIAENVPVAVTYKWDEIPRAVVWGNLGDGEQVSQASPGSRMESMFVTAAKDAEGYAVGADNLFFGIQRLSGKSTENIVISPKTGRITVTVKGLDGYDQSDQYYFTVETPYDSYDFAGNPLPGEAVLKLDGVFQGRDLATDEAYHMFHFPPAGTGEESLTVSLYRISAGSDQAQLLATVNKDTCGEPIAILREQTTNLLINFKGTGDLEIIVIITDWDTIHQWDYW